MVPLKTPGSGTLPQNDLTADVDNAAVSSELTRILYSNALRSNLVVLAAAAIIFFVFWSKLPKAVLLGWGSCVAAIVSYRFHLLFQYNRKKSADAGNTFYSSRYIAATFAVATCWLIIIALGLRMPGFEERIFFVLLLVSLLGASVPALAANLTAIYIYVIVPTTAAIPLLILRGGEDAAIGIALLLYTIMILKSGQHVYGTLLSSIQLRFHLQGLKENLEIKVSERTAELEVAKNIAEKANRTKSVFLANMSHEIRTPMNAIINLSQLALQEEMSLKSRDFIERVNNSGLGLLGIINDILDFSKIESGKLNIETIPFELAKIFAEIKNELGFRAVEKGLDFTIELAPHLHQLLLGDPLRVRQILTNIISNAIKFTNQGNVTVIAKEIARKSDQLIVEFTVIDTGVGISPEKQDNLFKPFHQADDSTTRKYGGSGLGLVISVQLAELMGGSIFFTSVPGAGSTFCIRLPFIVPEAQDYDTRETEPDTSLSDKLAVIKGAEVLIVDDIIANQIILASIMENAGISSTLANNGHEALEKLKSRHFDLVFMDIQMPEMDGYQATRIIRSEDKWAKLPIIAMTAHVFPEDVQRCYEAGMDFCLLKPFVLDDVHSVLVRWIPGKK